MTVNVWRTLAIVAIAVLFVAGLAAVRRPPTSQTAPTHRVQFGGPGADAAAFYASINGDPVSVDTELVVRAPLVAVLTVEAVSDTGWCLIAVDGVEVVREPVSSPWPTTCMWMSAAQ